MSVSSLVLARCVRATGYCCIFRDVSALSFNLVCPQLLFSQGRSFSGHLSMPSSQEAGRLGLEVSWHWRGTAPEGISPFNCWRGKKFKHLESKNNFLKIIVLGFPGERYCQNSLFLPVYYLHSLNKRKHTIKQAKKQPTKNPHQKNSKTKPQTELHNQLHLCLHLLPMSVYAWWVTSVYGTLFLPDFSLNLPVFWGGFFWRVWMLFKGWKSPLGKFSC